MKKLCLLALALTLTTPTISRQLSSDPGPMPICPPSNPNGCLVADNSLLLQAIR